MPVLRERVSLSQFAELIGVPPSRLNGLEVDRRGAGTVTLVLEPEEPEMEDNVVPPPALFTVDHEHRPRLYTADGRPRAVQTSGTNPPLTQGGKKVGGRKPKR